MPPTRSRILLWSAASGACWALAWPGIGGVTAFAFVAWLPLLQAERLHQQRTGGQRAFVPYAMLGLFLWNLSCSWWFWCVSTPWPTKLLSVAAPVLVNTLLMSLPWLLKRWSFKRAGETASQVVFLTAWLALERLHHDWDLQWPWLSLGNVFGTRPAWVQWYDHTGMLGGSLWLLLVNLSAFGAIRNASGAFSYRLRKMLPSLALLIAPLLLSYAMWTAPRHAEGPSYHVVVVQPNIDPYEQKFAGAPMDHLEGMLQLADAAISDSTDLVVFPETALQEGATVDLMHGELAFNGLWENDLEASRSVRRLRAFQATHPSAALLCGMSSDRLLKGDEVQRSTARPLGDGKNFYESYNAAVWLPAKGAMEVYHKSKLVAGVELMPFEEVLGPLGDLALDLGGTTGSLGQQEKRSVLTDAATALKVVPVICYESVFPEHVAAHVRNGGNLIAIITNDAWWGNSPGHVQHLAFASLRAIETRRWVVRSANTGISCAIDPKGELVQRSTWWIPTALACSVRSSEHITFFVAHGDLIGRAALVMLPLLLVVIGVRSRRIQRTDQEG